MAAVKQTAKFSEGFAGIARPFLDNATRFKIEESIKGGENKTGEQSVRCGNSGYCGRFLKFH